MKNFINLLIEQKIKKFPLELINEGLIKSIDYDIFEKRLILLFSKYNKFIDIHITYNGINLKINNGVFNKHLYNNFISLLNVCGYIISYFYYDNDKEIDTHNRTIDEDDIFNVNYQIIKIHLIKKFDVEEVGIPIILYHITEKIKLKKILKIGLVPKSKNKIENHPERIYLLSNLNETLSLKKIFNELYDKNYIILKIETRLLPKIKLYKDPTYFNNLEDYEDITNQALYTYDNIPNYAISKLI